MVLLGVSAGMFVVPVQVYLQQAPPPEFKGRLLGVQNLVTWIGILLSAAFVGVSGIVLKMVAGAEGDVRHQWVVFACLAFMMLPVCLFYRLPQAKASAAAIPTA
jgi:acyl-[acyl-carrier-protein]-phospholipid O-acyltransferase/long-chain-fatty-acid--[acyl-carrier-protein] ligase